ncbi:MAG: hypothetical protein GX414_09800 [Acidobacteria bacterium]|nr:hypothetical protein [Acidobacteriota bacterium]
MKETVFKINISVKIPEQSRVYEQLISTINELPGVTRVDLPSDHTFETVEMSVSVRFNNAEEAQSLHKKILRLITRCDGVCVAGISYDLNAMFGES